MQFYHFLTHFWCFSTLDILEKSLGPLRVLTQSSMQNNLRFNKNLLEIISEEIKPNCEISENLTSVYHFGRFLVEFDMFWCFDFSCFGKYIMVFCGISQRFRRKKIWELLNYSIRSQMNNPLPKSRNLENRHFSHIMIDLSPFRAYNWQFWTFGVCVKARGALRDLIEVPQGKNLRFIKKFLQITSEEIIARMAKPLKLEFYLIFREIFVDSWCIMDDLDFLSFCKTTRCSAGSHRGSAGKKSEIYQNFSSDRKWGNHCSNSRTS